MVPAVPMGDMIRQAIRLFDSGSRSYRFYDLANCLDGLTFGFGNWPQPEIGDFFGTLMADQAAGPTFIKRSMEVFTSDPAAWIALRRRVQEIIQERRTHGGETRDIEALDIGAAPPPTEAAVRDALDMLLVQSKMKRAWVTNTASGCNPLSPKGVAFYQDNKDWFVPVWSRAGRDPAIVAFQVAYWDRDVLQPAVKNAKAIGLGTNGAFLLAFYESNPGQVPDLRDVLRAQRPPLTLRAGGRQWEWGRPPQHLNVDLDTWHNLLLWQAMCPVSDKNFRIRSRNVAYFKQYLAPTFRLPVESNGVPNEHGRANCDPSKVTLRRK
jgi:hypothetical protein